MAASNGVRGASIFPGCIAVLAFACSAAEGDAGPDPFVNNGGGNGGGTNSGVGGTLGASGSAPVGNGGSGLEGNNPGGVAGQSQNGGVGGTTGSSVAGQGGSAGSAQGMGGSEVVAMGGSAGSEPVPGVSCDDGSAFLCDGFEGVAAGAFPTGSAWVPNPCASHVVDAAVKRTGSQSLRGGAQMYPACMAHADISSQSEVYARSWIQLGESSTQSGHEVGILEFGPTTADNPEVRVGFRDNDSVCVAAPGLEVTVDGVAGGERTTCTGVALDAGRWYCLEVHFSRAPGRISFGVKVDGNDVVEETQYDDATAWTDGPMFMKLGRSAYGGNMTWPVWHDDVIVSSSPVGCTD